MKDRILAYLDDFIHHQASDLAAELQKELKLDTATFTLHVEEVRSEILHKYSQFAVSTIDAFFQRVIRAFTREAGLAGDYRLEVENEPVLEEVVDNLLDELGSNQQLTNWVVDFARNKLEDDKSWDFRPELVEFAKEVFEERFRELEAGIEQITQRHDFFESFRKELNKNKSQYTRYIRSRAIEAMKLIHDNQLTAADFKYGLKGSLYSFFAGLTELRSVKEYPVSRTRAETLYIFSKNVPSEKSIHRSRLLKLAEEQLVPLLKEINEHHATYAKSALTAEVILENFYAFGLLSDISRKLKEYKSENNLMLLSDAPYFLNSVIADSDTPFVYEKVGSFFKNFLIDEFQDTSGLQWKNFMPLITNSLDSGYPSYIVGDVKQAIYRWRSGDLFLLHEQVEKQIGEKRVQKFNLDKNYRSSREVVTFNNALFAAAAGWVARETGAQIAADVYEHVVQDTVKHAEGFVDISFLSDQEDTKWDKQALDLVPVYLERLQDLGVALKDIAILVRYNSEGSRIVAHLLDFKFSHRARPGYKYDVVSNESLQVDGASSVNFLVSALRYLLNPEDDIARAQLMYEHARWQKSDNSLHEVFMSNNPATFDSQLPDSFTRQRISLKKLPLFELTETLIGIFNLGSKEGELEYLQTFQNEVLSFSSRERNDLRTFLEWWEENKSKKSIQISGDVDAAQILTIHKSKGLQFQYVLVPFCSWEVDHANKSPLLWVTTQVEPFSQGGQLPVQYSSKLKDTWFAEYYQQEKVRVYLDNLNLLYVAFTRAEHGLIVTAPNRKSSIAGLLQTSLSESPVLTNRWNAAARVWKSGTWSLAPELKPDVIPSITLKHYSSTSWRNKLVIRQDSAGHFDSQPGETAARIRYGIFLHKILSRIRYRDDLDQTFGTLIHTGVIQESERPTLMKLINELMANQVIASWFERDWNVRTEVPVLLPGGKESRIDRLITQGSKAVVVDFKTGNPAPQDRNQVADYLDQLKKMGFKDVSGFLLYIKSGEVATVPASKPVRAAKRDSNQLGLDL